MIPLEKRFDGEKIRRISRSLAYVALLTGQDIMCDQWIEELKSDGALERP